MTFGAMLTEMTIFGVFLIAGFLIRELIKPLQKLFIPSSIIGGVIALVGGQQILGLWEVPASFSSYSGTLIRFVMCSIIFGVTLNLDKMKSYGDYMMVVHSVYGWQMALGIGLGALFCKIWPSLPTGWGFQGVQSFYGGHGTAGAAGAVFEEITASTDVTSIGMVLATFGLVFAMVFGMMVVNFGVRRGWATFVKEPQKQPPSFYGGLLPKEEQKSIGTALTSSISVNAVALQFAWILAAMFVGEKLFALIGTFLPVVKQMPLLTYDTVGGLILYPILKMVKLDTFVDKKTVSQLSGCALEILILGAVATLNISVVISNAVPLLLFTAIMCGLTVVWPLFMAHKTCSEQWFEKALMIIGQSTGATPTGLALVRAVDPNSECCAPDAHGIYSGLTFWTTFFTALLPMSLADGNISVGIIAGLIQFIVCACIGFGIFGTLKRRSKSKNT
ncbi:sodium/glutamate symporter [Eubacteriales bacterium]|nr:sodium/glutamate symporter [Eubacteriales bacterium]GKH49729.1 sodium/glutamate symporter [Eubacteriales bacterium]GKH62365.1 sodium/glutamate symporter [Eubacteriales bacterium]